MVYYCSRAKHQPDWDPWRRSLHPPHRCLHHLHQVILINDGEDNDQNLHDHHPQQHHPNDVRRRKRWSGSVRDAESDGDLLAAHLHQVLKHFKSPPSFQIF